MQGAFWYSCIFLLSGYYQFRVRGCDIPFTAFQTPDGAYEYLVLPMGLSNAPSTFNDGIRRILFDLREICQCYFDDIYVYTKSKSLKYHLTALDRVLTRLEDHQFYVKISKCIFCVPEIFLSWDYVGRDDQSHSDCEWMQVTTLLEESSFKRREDGVIERPVAFGGLKYKDAKKNYSICEKEIYLLDKPFVVETDYRSLETIFTQKTISRRVPRWYDELSEYPIKFGTYKEK
ncbi:LOW QUALITY PROTEIN: Gag/polymerase/env Polyprotein [Phytophthora megakarya]|uniref:Gag/polymerase/env Polyprotein n=1 Tax=Phytophthora megakarya TaxID=4795 RepID=A0A225WPC9_9STRA|nr:LOW QUALITY PROTEIN: Gag/polymerase/env Polyprotein [Phytophthora megakarya]